jgi:hypothetical protein
VASGSADKGYTLWDESIVETGLCKSSKNRDYFGDFDPFGDFDLLFDASKLNLKIVEMPIRYRSRSYGDTNID